MRKIIFFVVFSFLTLTIFSQNNWKWLTPNPPNKKVYSSVIVGNNAYLWCEARTVMKMNLLTEQVEPLSVYTTIDNVGIDDFANQGIGFADSLTGYITDISCGEFRTTDGGKEWIQTANPGSNINLVVFASSKRGWKLGVGGFYKTDNVGKDWTYINIPFIFIGTYSKMFALDENNLWVLISSSYSGNKGGIWYSPNGGNMWTEVNTGLISDSMNRVSYIDFKINSSGIGFAIGTIFRADSNITEGFIQRTSDMGKSWSTIMYRDERYKNILSINDNEWVILGNKIYYSDYTYNNIIIQRKTTDMGNSWFLSYPIQESLNYYTYFQNGFYYQTTDIIYIFTSRGIYKSKDRGNSYSKVTSETDVYVSEIVFDSKPLNPENQISLAWRKWFIGPYLISFDGGHTWQKKSLPNDMGYIWLVGIAEEVIYIIVNQTKLYKSIDYGDTWEKLEIPLYSGLQALDVYSKDNIVLNGYKNLISSTDGGKTWILGPSLENLWLEATDIISPGNIVGVGTYYDTSGYSGAFYHTTDYGLSWHIIDTDNELYKIQMLNGRIGYALGDYKLYKTLNSGESWSSILSQNGYQHFFAFIFSDSLTGIVSGPYYFLLTNNGGLSWTTKNFKIPLLNINDMKYNTKGDLFIVGDGAILISSNQEVIQGNKENVEFSEMNFYLSQNYPNPFNPSTNIRFQIPEQAFVTLKIFDILGKEVATLVNEEKSAGEYEVEFSGNNFTSGLYFYQLKTDNFIETKKMILLK